MTRPDPGGERGQTVAFVLGITLALLLLIGLTIDGGRVLTGRELALDEAQEASRTAAQQLDEAAVRRGAGVVLDPAAASRAAQRYLQASGDIGTVVVRGTDVTVTVRREVSMQLLSLAGMGTVTVSESGSAHAALGGGTTP